MATLDCTVAPPLSAGPRSSPRQTDPAGGSRRSAADPRWYPFQYRPWPLASDSDERDLDLAVALDVPVLIDADAPPAAAELARRIHDHSERRGGPWIMYTPGVTAGGVAAGDAGSDAAGRLTTSFASADGGTLFVDDLGALTPPEQEALSRLLDDADSLPSARHDATPHGVRLIAAARPGLLVRLAGGEFSERLYYRVNLIRLACVPRHQMHTSPARA